MKFSSSETLYFKICSLSIDNPASPSSRYSINYRVEVNDNTSSTAYYFLLYLNCKKSPFIIFDNIFNVFYAMCHNTNFTLSYPTAFLSPATKACTVNSTIYFIHTFILTLFFHSLIQICHYFLQNYL